MSTLRVCLIAAVIGAGGCSWLGAHGPAAPHSPTDCTNHYALPIVDTVPAVIGLVGGVAGIADGLSNLNVHADYAQVGFAIGPPLLLIGALYTASAIHGYRAVARCRDARPGATGGVSM